MNKQTAWNSQANRVESLQIRNYNTLSQGQQQKLPTKHEGFPKKRIFNTIRTQERSSQSAGNI